MFRVLGYKTHKNDSASCSYQIHGAVQSGRGAWKKNHRNEINNVNEHRVWLCIRVTFFSSIGIFFGLPADCFVLTEIEVLLKPGLTGRTVLERCWSGEQNSSPLDTVQNRFTYIGDR